MGSYVSAQPRWRPTLPSKSGSFRMTDFLTFAGKRKRIAFSASIGMPEIPEEHRAFYSERLRDFAHISVREDAAAAIVHDLTGRTVPVTIDPTLMLGEAD